MSAEQKVTPDQGKSRTSVDVKARPAEDLKTKNPELKKILIVTPEQIDAKLEELKGVLPSLLLNKLAESLKMARVTEAQCDEIVMKTVDQFKNSGNANAIQMEEIFQKLENLDHSILSLVQFLEQLYRAGGAANAQLALAQQLEPAKDLPNTEAQQKEPIKNPVTEIQEMPKTLPEAPKKEPLVNNGPLNGCPKNSCEPAESKPVAGKQIVEENQVVRLTHIDNKIENEIVLLKWIEFLLERVGRENLPRTLEFYEDIGWINDETVEKILTYARGVSVSQKEQGFSKELGVKDHIQSLLFIEKLRGCEIDKQSIIVLEKDIVAIRKGSEGIYGI